MIRIAGGRLILPYGCRKFVFIDIDIIFMFHWTNARQSIQFKNYLIGTHWGFTLIKKAGFQLTKLSKDGTLCCQRGQSILAFLPELGKRLRDQKLPKLDNPRKT
jgi:hypothetical protein